MRRASLVWESYWVGSQSLSTLAASRTCGFAQAQDRNYSDRLSKSFEDLTGA